MYIITLQPVVGVFRHRGRGSRSSYTPQRQHAIAQTLYGFCAVNTTKKRRRCCPAVFPNALKGRKGEKEMGILNCKKGWGPESRGERM